MALIVKIYVNEIYIGMESAMRITGVPESNSINTYILKSNNEEIKHKYGDGAAVLAVKMMKNLVKQGGI